MADEETVHLNEAEVAAVARRLVAQHVEATADQILWEDNPMFGEVTWEAISDAIDLYALDLAEVAKRYDQATDIDSLYLLGRARA